MNNNISKSMFAALVAVGLVGASVAQTVKPGLNRVPSEWGKRLQALQNVAKQAEARGDLASAEKAYREVLKHFPDSVWQHLPLAKLYDREGRDMDALVEYQAIVIRKKGNRASLVNDPRILSRFGELSNKFGRTTDAQMGFSMALSVLPKKQPVAIAPRNKTPQAIRAAAHMGAGYVNLLVGNPKDAVNEIDLAVKADPGNWVGYYYMGRAMARSRDFEGAKANFAKALRMTAGDDNKAVKEAVRFYHLTTGGTNVSVSPNGTMMVTQTIVYPDGSQETTKKTSKFAKAS